MIVEWWLGWCMERADRAWKADQFHEAARLYDRVGRRAGPDLGMDACLFAAQAYLQIGEIAMSKNSLARLHTHLDVLPPAEYAEWHAAAHRCRAQIHRVERRFDDALSCARQARDLHDDEGNRFVLATAYKMAGQLDAAIAELEALLERAPETASRQALVGYLYLAGERERAAALHEAIPRGRRNRVPWNEAWIAACRGDRADCLRWMRTSFERGWSPRFLIAFFEMDVEFDRYRDAEFARILASHGAA